MELISPILAKDLRPLLRSRKAFWLMLTLLVCVGLMLVFVGAQAAAFTTISMRSIAGRAVFMVVSCAQLCCFGLFAPALTASSISNEREMRTFDLLESTALSRFDILWNKWWAAIAFLMLAAVLLLPIQTMVFQFGGVGLDEYLAVAAVIVAVVSTYGMLGLAVSSMFRRSATALSVTLLVVLMLNIGAPMMLIILADQNLIGLSEQESFEASTNFSAILSFIAMFQSGLILRGPQSALSAVLPLLVVHLILFLICARIAFRNLRRVESVRVAVARKLIHDPAVIEKRRKRFPYYVIDPLARAHHIPDGKDPVLAREQRTGALSRPTVLIRICYGALLLSIVFGLERIINDTRGAPGHFAILLMIIGTLFIPALAALTVSKERESGTLELLLTSPIRPMQIVIAKFRATLRFMIYICASFLAFPFFIYLVHLGTSLPEKLKFIAGALILIVPYLAAFFSLFAAAGILMSCISRRTSVALVSTYLLIIILSFFPYLMLLVAFVISRLSSDSQDWDTGFLARFVGEDIGRSLSAIEYLDHRGWREFSDYSGSFGAVFGPLTNAFATLFISWVMLRLAAAILARRART